MYRFTTELWRWESNAGWYFVTVPEDISDEIEGRTGQQQRGFGSVRVRVTIGQTTWATSVFPDAKRQAYVLPVKKDVRTREGITEGMPVDVALAVVDG